jgi:hypothetical protein
MLVDCCVVSSCWHPEVWVQETILLMKRIVLVLQEEFKVGFSNRTVLWGVEDEILVGICIRGGRIGSISSRV